MTRLAWLFGLIALSAIPASATLPLGSERKSFSITDSAISKFRLTAFAAQ